MVQLMLVTERLETAESIVSISTQKSKTADNYHAFYHNDRDGIHNDSNLGGLKFI